MKMFRNSGMSQFITIILVAAFFWASMPICKSQATQPAAVAQKAAPAAPAQGTIPGNKILVRPFLIIAHFPTGTTIITGEMEQELYELLETMKLYPQIIVELQGAVSTLRIRNGCYYDPNDGAFFNLHYGPVRLTGSTPNETNDLCQKKLGSGRSWAVTNWLMAHGVDPTGRIFILDNPVTDMREGGNLVNQAVIAWLVNPGAPISEDSEIPTITLVQSQPCTSGPTPTCVKPTVKVNSPCPYTTDMNLVNGVWVIDVVVTCPEPEHQAAADKKHKVSPWLIGAGITAIALIVLCSIEVKGAEGPNGKGGDVRVCPFK